MTTRRVLVAATPVGTTVTVARAPGVCALGIESTWSQSRAVPGSPEPGDRFGAALAVGDLDDDDDHDLAVGARGESIGSLAAAGGVDVVSGGSSDLAESGTQFFSRSTAGVAETGGRFGAALAAGDFDGDGHDDSVICTPGEALGSTSRAGMVRVHDGSSSGVVTSGVVVAYGDDHPWM